MGSFNPAITERLNALSEGVLSGHYIFSRDYDESYLARRFAQPEKYAHNISYGVSNNPKHIQQYYSIRQQAYRDVIQKYISKGAHIELNKDFYAGEDEHDKRSIFFLALAGNNCIGGIRLTISTPENPNKLTMEDDSFSLQDHFPELDLSKITYCEASKLAVIADYRNGDLWNHLHNNSTEYLLKEIGMEIGFCQSHGLQTRRVKTQFQNLGYEMIVRKDIHTHATEEFKEMNMQFWAMDFTAEQKYVELLKAPQSQSVADKELEFA